MPVANSNDFTLNYNFGETLVAAKNQKRRVFINQ